MPPSRVYVRIRVRISPDGTMQPLAILWDDGQEFEIDRVLDVRRAASEAESRGMRYTVKILGKQRLLFYEDVYSETGKPRWFIESWKGVPKYE